MVMLPKEKISTVKSFFDGVNDIILQIVDLIMLAAPYGVFALIAGLVVDFGGSAELFKALVDGSTHLVAEVKTVGIWAAYRAYLGHENSHELLFGVHKKVGRVCASPEKLTHGLGLSMSGLWIFHHRKSQSKTMPRLQV